MTHCPSRHTLTCRINSARYVIHLQSHHGLILELQLQIATSHPKHQQAVNVNVPLTMTDAAAARNSQTKVLETIVEAGKKAFDPSAETASREIGLREYNDLTER